MGRQATREIPYIQRIIPNLLDDVREARNSGSPDEYSRAVDTLEMFLPVERPNNIKMILRRFKNEDKNNKDEDKNKNDKTLDEKYNGNGFFDKTYADKKTELDEQFQEREILQAERQMQITDYRFQYIMYLLEEAGLLIHERGGAFDVSGFD